MSNSTEVKSGGIGLPGLLTVLFVGLKLGHVINWSWFWVLSPLWISASIWLVVLILAIVIAAALG